MPKISCRLKIQLIGLFLAGVAGCTGTPERAPSAVYVPSIMQLAAADYPSEIEKYKRIIQSDLHLDIQQHAHLYLASLYFSPMNPDRNYKLALKHLETYALYDPDFLNGVDPRLLMAAIIEIKSISATSEAQSMQIKALHQEVEILQRQAMATRGRRRDTWQDNRMLKKRINKMQRKIRSLEKSNARLNKTIEMLSTLDARLEEKRSNFKGIESPEEQ